MTQQDKIAKIWERWYWDALGCGCSDNQATRIANQKVREWIARN